MSPRCVRSAQAGQTALHLGAWHDRAPTVALLLRKGASVDAVDAVRHRGALEMFHSSSEPLARCESMAGGSAYREPELMALPTSFRPLPPWLPQRGRTPLLLAAEAGAHECVAELLRAGARHDADEQARRHILAPRGPANSSPVTDAAVTLPTPGEDAPAQGRREGSLRVRAGDRRCGRRRRSRSSR